MNRKQRRAIAKVNPGAVLQTAGKLQEALGALRQFDGVGPQIEEANRLMGETHRMVELLVDDVQALSNELALLRQVVLMDPGMNARFEALTKPAKMDAPCPKCVETDCPL